MSDPLDVPIRDTSIRLGQLLKLSGLVEDGAMARELVQGGQVQVDGAVETRRGAQVALGSVVALGGDSIRVVAAADDGD